MTAAEIEDLEECSEMFDFTGFMPEEDRRLIAEVKRLRVALVQYGRHAEPCGRAHYEGLVPCRCGFDEAMA